jgi:hypothetical protein
MNEVDEAAAASKRIKTRLEPIFHGEIRDEDQNGSESPWALSSVGHEEAMH